MFVQNNSIFLTEDDIMLNRIVPEDFIFEKPNNYYIDIITTDGKDGKFSVDWYLYATDNLVKIADKLRKTKGFLPMFPENVDSSDGTGWYNFYFTVVADILGLNGLSDPTYELYFSVSTDLSSDDGECYFIGLPDGFTSQVVSHLESSCDINIKTFLNDEYFV